MNQVKLLEKCLNQFLKIDDEENVVLIRGEWGVGKTYFWDKYISKLIKQAQLKYTAYSYVSLFGKNSLEDIQSSIFVNSVPVKAIESNNQKNNIFDTKLKYLEGHWKKVKGFVEKIPGISQFSNLTNHLQNLLVDNYIICFDDLERRGNNISVKEFMGLMDELALRKNCKIILIFNDKSLEGDSKREFLTYKEKVIDLELFHNPTHEYNLSIAFKKDEYFNELKLICETLNLKNIRILNKINRIANEFNPHFENLNKNVKKEFLKQLFVFTWAYYSDNGEFTYENLLNILEKDYWWSGSRSLQDFEKKESIPEKKTFDQISYKIGLGSSLFDSHITKYLEKVIIDVDCLKKDILEIELSAETEQIKESIERAKAIFYSSFNEDELIEPLNTLLENNIDKVYLNNYIWIINLLTKLNQNTSKFNDSYITAHESKLRCLTSGNISPIFCSDFKNKLNKIKGKRNTFDIDDILNRILGGSWSPEEVEYLASLSDNDYIKWIESAPKDLYEKITKGLLRFKNMRSGDGKSDNLYKQVYDTSINALKSVGSTNDLNKARLILAYGLDPDIKNNDIME